MKAAFRFLATVSWCLSAGAAMFEQQDLFVSGTEGYHTFRIPALVAAADGTLLAFAEGRRNSSGDSGDIDIVLRRSGDHGQTWSPLQVVHSDAANTYGNPAPVVDLDTGTVFLLATRNLGTDAESAIRAGTSVDTRRVFVQQSTDSGASWTSPVEITATTKLPDWRWYATGPGHGIQLERGAAAGRLLVGGDYTLNSGSGDNVMGSHLIYSDDHGATWQIGGIFPPQPDIYPNECTAVELTDGRVYLNSRDHYAGNAGNRAVSYSEDGGLTLNPATFAIDPSLVAPVVQGATLRVSATDQGEARDRILFSSPGHPTSRLNLSVRSSFDETASWTAGKTVYSGPSAYSDLSLLPNGRIGLLYEYGASSPYERIGFASFTEEWLDGTPPAGTIALWKLDEQAPGGTVSTAAGAIRDASGRDLHATAGLALPYVTGDSRFGGGSAVRFNGAAGQGLKLTDQESGDLLDFAADDSFTIEVLFRTTAHGIGAGIGGALVAKDVGPNMPSWWLRVRDNRLQFLVADGQGHEPYLFSTVEVNDGTWHHVAAVRDAASGELQLFVDYRPAGSTADTTVAGLQNSNSVFIGDFNVGGRAFIGDLDLVRITGLALTPDLFYQIPEPATSTLVLLLLLAAQANSGRRRPAPRAT